MVGRHRSKDGILYSQHGMQDYSPNEINFDNCLNDDKEEYIYVMAHRPGIGKTTSVNKYLQKKIETNKDFKFFYFTDRHESINKITEKWKKDTYSHWMGFDKKCINSRMKNNYKYHLNPNDICNSCKKCDGYFSQFKNAIHVFAPFDYLISSHFSDTFEENQPDIIFLDENIKQFKSYSNDADKAKKLLNEMGRKDLEKLIDIGNYKDLEKELAPDKFYDEYKDFILKLASDKGKNRDLLDFIIHFNIFDFYQYLRWENIYGYHLKSYGVPSLYYGAFEAVANGIPAVFMDATFNLNFFSYLLECYNAESKFIGKKKFTNLMMTIYHDNIENLKVQSTIYRMRPEDYMPKSNFVDSDNWEHTKDWLSTDMKLIMDIFGKNNVGIITFKDLGEFPKALGYNVEYYGNLRGTNSLEKLPVLVIIGTYIPMLYSWHPNIKEDTNKECFDELLSKYFLIQVDRNNLKSVGVQAPEAISSKYDYKIAKSYGYLSLDDAGTPLGTPGDEIVKHPAEALLMLSWYDEIYQAFHRNRGLRYPRIVFAYCWFPEPNAILYTTDAKGKITSEIIGQLSLFNHNLRDEFVIDKVFNDNLTEIFDFLADTDYGRGGIIEEIVSEILQNPNITSKELTQKYRIFKDEGGADTIPMTKLIEGIRTLKQKAKEIEIESSE